MRTHILTGHIYQPRTMQLRYNCPMSLPPKPFRPHLFTALLAAMALAACGRPGPEGAFDTYLDRLARPLESDYRSPERPAMPALPRRAALRLDLPGTSLDTLDFLALSGCEVQITIGKRNSSLGRMASASQRLLLDLEYLRLAPACIDHLQAQGERQLARQLRQAHQLKREQLPARIFLATLGGPEYRTFWRRPAQLGDYPRNTSGAVVDALRAITAASRRWLAGDYRADNRQFELQLGEVNKGDGGALLLALATQSTWLAQADELLRRRVGRGPLCTEHLRPAAADILPNVVQRYFVEAIQPWSAALGRRQYQLLPPVRELEQSLAGALPEAYARWRQRRAAALKHWTAAPRRHVGEVKALLAPCQKGGK